MIWLAVAFIALLAALFVASSRRRRSRTASADVKLFQSGDSVGDSPTTPARLLPPTVPKLTSLTRLYKPGACVVDIHPSSVRCPTPIEREEVGKLRARLQQDNAVAGAAGAQRWYEDAELLRFVRARRTLNDSEVMFHEAMRMRRTHATNWGVDVSATGSFGPEFASYLEGGQQAAQPPDWFTFLRDHLSVGNIGQDKHGLPIVYCALGNDDLQGCVREVGMDNLKHYAVLLNDYFLDTARAATLRLHEHLELEAGVVLLGGDVIIDMDGLSLASLGKVKVFNAISAIIKVLHPERIQRCFVVRAPRSFAMAWSLCSAIVDPRTVAKTTVFRRGESLEPLISELGAKNIPNFLGGTNTTLKRSVTRTVSRGALAEHQSGNFPDAIEHCGDLEQLH